MPHFEMGILNLLLKSGSRATKSGLYPRRRCEVEQRNNREKEKGCDIGYALAASSCEEADSVETCTVTALDAIAAFAVPNPNYPSQGSRFFRVWLLTGLPQRTDHSAYFGLANVLFSANPFSRRREPT